MSKIEDLREQLAESKQREATLTLERDAARNALEIARGALYFYSSESRCLQAIVALAKMRDPTAALAERDRAIERKTAERCIERCIEIMQSNCYSFDVADVSAVEIRREFKLDALT